MLFPFFACMHALLLKRPWVGRYVKWICFGLSIRYPALFLFVFWISFPFVSNPSLAVGRLYSEPSSVRDIEEESAVDFCCVCDSGWGWGAAAGLSGRSALCSLQTWRAEIQKQGTGRRTFHLLLDCPCCSYTVSIPPLLLFTTLFFSSQNRLALLIVSSSPPILSIFLYDLTSPSLNSSFLFLSFPLSFCECVIMLVWKCIWLLNAKWVWCFDWSIRHVYYKQDVFYLCNCRCDGMHFKWSVITYMLCI